MPKGGVTQAKDLPYCPPCGPTNMGHKGPGLGGGTNHGNGQRHSPGSETSGSVGLHGTTKREGSQR